MLEVRGARTRSQMSILPILFSTTPTKEPWYWATADAVVAVLLLLNVLLLVVVHGREVREGVRARRTARFRASFEQTLAELRSERLDEARLQRELRGLNELERPIAARMLTEDLRTASADGRSRICTALREIGGIDLMLRSARRLMPWRRALAVRTLGLVGAEEAVPELITRLSDRSRYVREAAVRALGRIEDERALPALAYLFANPGRVAPGLVYEALIAFRDSSAQVFRDGLHSPDEHVRVASVFGVASLEPEVSRARLERMLADGSAAVRTAAAEMLGRIGGAQVTDDLTRATRDEQPSVRRAAVSALGAYDDWKSLQLALDALDDPDRDTALRAGEALVRLSRQPNVGTEAAAATAANASWPVEAARLLSALETR
jgi:HEAT repeat protein